MKRFFLRFRAFCASSIPLLVFLVAIANFIVTYKVSCSVHPVYHYRTFVITNEVSSVSSSNPLSVDTNQTATSVLSSILGSPSPTSTEKKDQLPEDRSIPVSYRYSLCGNEPVAFLFGRYYYEGETTSRGLILRIFPDRIYLHNGSYFVNTSFGLEKKKEKGF